MNPVVDAFKNPVEIWAFICVLSHEKIGIGYMGRNKNSLYYRI